MYGGFALLDHSLLPCNIAPLISKYYCYYHYHHYQYYHYYYYYNYYGYFCS